MKIDSRKCPQNHPCPAIAVCPVKAISQKGFGLPEIDNGKCINCGKCTSFCPKKAFIP
jgi:ferredoxin